jgi:hypothetical protein
MNRHFHLAVCSALIIFLCSCGSVPKGAFTETGLPAPDYSKNEYWSALPFLKDSADAVPIAAWCDEQPTSGADIFFIHPTTYIGKTGQKNWNADVNDKTVNAQVDKAPIRYQATIFNGAGKIYAPRYRQAHLHTFYSDNKSEAQKAAALAYHDVRSAFQYYLENYNNGRPFIIAAHSQGSFHGMMLIKEIIDGTPLQEKLIAAYLPGWPIPKDFYKNISPCTSPQETGCFTSWRTVKRGYFPPAFHMPEKNILATNPVTWTLDTIAANQQDQLGGVLLDFKTVRPALVCAQVCEDLVWVNKPKFPGSILLTKRNYHIADYNFFYADVRKNAQDRVRAYFAKQKS